MMIALEDVGVLDDGGRGRDAVNSKDPGCHESGRQWMERMHTERTLLYKGGRGSGTGSKIEGSGWVSILC